MKKLRFLAAWIMSLLFACSGTLFSACVLQGTGTSSSEGSSISASDSEEESSQDSPDDKPVFATGISSFDDGYASGANWVWANAEVKQGQWAAMRKTFTLDEAPKKAVARISADTKYWLWINGELAIFEGQLKLGNSIQTWFYDKEDITKYLVEGENTIAVQVFYSGKTSSSTINTGVPAFLFDADIDGKRIFSNTSWKAVIDPAYEEPINLNNIRIGEANIKYNAASAMVDGNGKQWTDKDYDDSAWASAVIVDRAILNNRIYNDWGAVSEVYYKNTDPRRHLVLRSIPQMKVSEITKFTESGSGNTWTKETGGYAFNGLSLPDTYTLEAEVSVGEPIAYEQNQPVGAAIGFCVCMSDNNNFYMPQISFQQGDLFNGVAYKPHIKTNGNWSVTNEDLTNSQIGQDLYVQGLHDYRYSTTHTVKIEVTPQTISTYLNGTLLGVIYDTTHARTGSTIGFRQDVNELVKIHSLKVTNSNGQALYNANISGLSAGDSLQTFSLLAAENGGVSSAYNRVEKEGDNAYVSVRNGCIGVNNGDTGAAYTIVNPTNIQGTPYLKVRSANGGELIYIKSDTWVNGDSSSIAHQYITKAGEQSWEALGWMNGYEITFFVPNGVEVMELGFRQSGYDTKASGSVTTDNDVINQLYQEAYDTLYVCMRDSFMDCPDRERAQWLGDAVINMQQAAYSMDENAALLYKKTLTQAIGFVKQNGAIPSMIALGNDNLELPMQTLAGVHSFWQYYMYYGDKDLLIDSYPVLLNYLKLWNIASNGAVEHRGGTWDWIDWGEHYDTAVIETCWYYIALETVENIARLDGSNATAEDIQFLQSRRDLIRNSFDTLYWNYDKNAYYSWTDNGVADDRANAMAVYAGLATSSRYSGILNVLVNTYNASPYMEKYVLEAMYLMNAQEEATTRTLNRFGPFTLDGYPTLPEIWADQSMFGGDETKNHAWTGAPLSLLYMYNAGITPITAGFKAVQIKPFLGTLNHVSATLEKEVGTIAVDVSKTANGYTLEVTLPTSGSIYVPRASNGTVKLNGVTVYENGAPVQGNIPQGVAYGGVEEGFIVFDVTEGGTFSFVSE